MPTCHYEILSIPQDADEKAIKKSYRKLALKYHPDKNQENLEQATEKFRFVQAAYECLSDPQERAWYDDHRDAYIKGFKHTGDRGEKYEEDDTSHLFQYMSSLAFNGFDESKNREKNFYTVYRKLFSSVDEEENGDVDRASFGTSKSEWADVNEFYASWEAYVTNKIYGGADHYDTRQAQDRRMRRAMEQENQKVRDECKKKRNLAVRDLVRFVRKRDPRVIARNEYLTEKANQNKLKAEAKKKADLAKRVAETEEYEKEILKEMENDKYWEEEDHMGDLDEMWASHDEKDKRRGGKKKKVQRWDHMGRRVNIEGEAADTVINLGEKSEFLVAGNLGEKIAKANQVGSEDEMDPVQKSAIESWLADAKVDHITEISENSKSESASNLQNITTPDVKLENDVSYYFKSGQEKTTKNQKPEKKTTAEQAIAANIDIFSRELTEVERNELIQKEEDEKVAAFLAKKTTVAERDNTEVACAVKTTMAASFNANATENDNQKKPLTKKQRNALKKSKLAATEVKDEAVPEKSALAKKIEKYEDPEIDLSILKLSSDDGQDAFSQKPKKKKKKGKR